ncbi:PREDICTED: WAT1-related protein At3g30340-like [Tarenaya hassleriana]|uniref:WAT1-related protein At3g30340-like n=1 Tax=Tarenaya hassleriana TaxID=28532 RepID=UPI00053C803D|nr:PREDICTED: WAT1-related protein At3g30340-like [Tarenaya hassleriana]
MADNAVSSPFLTMVVVNFGFSLMNVLLKKVLDMGLSPLVFVTYRLLVSTIFLAPVGFFWERQSRPKLTLQILFSLFCSAVVGTSVTQYLFLLGIQYTSATFACAFVNLTPVLTFIMALPFGLERVNIRSNTGRAKVVGTVVCVGGAMLLTLYRGAPLFGNRSSDDVSVRETRLITTSSKGRPSGERWSLGTVALVVGSFLWSSWFLVQSKVSQRYPCQCSSTAIISFFGSIQSALLCLATSGWKPSAWALKGTLEILTVLYAGIVGSGLCYVGMSWCVKKRGPVFTAAFSPLIQIMAALIDIPFLHEQLHLGSLLGSMIVIIGLYTLLWGKRKEIKTSQEGQNPKEEDPQLHGLRVLGDPPCP